MRACLLAVSVLCALATGSAMAQGVQGMQGPVRIGVVNDMPGVNAGVLHYLAAVGTLGEPIDGAAAVAAMKAMPTDDPLFGKGTIPAAQALRPLAEGGCPPVTN